MFITKPNTFGYKIFYFILSDKNNIKKAETNLLLVPEVGLEPTRLSTLTSKDSGSTNFPIQAFIKLILSYFSEIVNDYLAKNHINLIITTYLKVN